MSGGSYDYAYFKIEELAADIEKEANARLLPRRMQFAGLLKLCAKAAHDIEWVDSCDYGAGDENKAIEAVFDFLDSKGDWAKLHRKAIVMDKIKELVKEL